MAPRKKSNIWPDNPWTLDRHLGDSSLSDRRGLFAEQQGGLFAGGTLR